MAESRIDERVAEWLQVTAKVAQRIFAGCDTLDKHIIPLAAILEPEWRLPNGERWRTWQAFVPSEAASIWSNMGNEARIAAFATARREQIVLAYRATNQIKSKLAGAWKGVVPTEETTTVPEDNPRNEWMTLTASARALLGFCHSLGPDDINCPIPMGDILCPYWRARTEGRGTPPDFYGDVHINWRIFIPDVVERLWPTMTGEARIAAFAVARWVQWIDRKRFKKEGMRWR